MLPRAFRIVSVLAALVLGCAVYAPAAHAAEPGAADASAPKRPRPTLVLEPTASARELLVARVKRINTSSSSIEGTYHDDVTPMSTGFSILGGGLRVGMAWQSPRGSGGMALVNYELGSMPYGLRTHTVFIGGEWHYSFVERFAIFVGGRWGWLKVERTTNNNEDPDIQHWGIGLNVGVIADVIRLDELRAIYLRPQIDAMLIPHALLEPRSLLWGGSIGVGVRL